MNSGEGDRKWGRQKHMARDVNEARAQGDEGRGRKRIELALCRSEQDKSYRVIWSKRDS